MAIEFTGPAFAKYWLAGWEGHWARSNA